MNKMRQMLAGAFFVAILCATSPAAGTTEIERLWAVQAIDAKIPAKPLRNPRAPQQPPAAEPVDAAVVAQLLPGQG